MILFGSAILAFNAGYVNGCTYQSLAGKGKPVSHITGTTTKAGLFAADHEYNDMLVNFTISCHMPLLWHDMAEGGELSHIMPYSI